jgi:MFS transporter, ACS family, glucarate transporter
VLWASAAATAPSAIFGFAVATFGVEMTISPSWSFCLDVGGRHSGTISAAMNTAGNLGGVASTNAFPLLQRLTGGSAAYFYAAAVLNAAAIVCWQLMPPLERREACGPAATTATSA